MCNTFYFSKVSNLQLVIKINCYSELPQTVHANNQSILFNTINFCQYIAIQLLYILLSYDQKYITNIKPLIIKTYCKNKYNQ